MGKHKKRRDRFTPAPVVAPVASSTASPGGPVLGAPTRRKTLLENLVAAFALGLLALFAFGNSFRGGWVLDNSAIIGDDTRIRDISSENIKAIFTHNYWWPTFESNLYRPLTTLSYLFNYTVLDNGKQVELTRQQDLAQGVKFDYGKLDNGAHLTGYHVVNFLLHWANIILVLLIVRRLSGRLDLAVIAAAIFAVHPLDVEAVTNIVGRADLFATLSILLGGWCYIKAGNAQGGKRVAWLVGAGLNALWGVFAKESAIVILPFVVLYDLIWRWPGLPGPTFARRCRQAFVEFFLKGWTAVLVPSLALIGVYLWMKYKSPVFGEIFADNPISHASSFFQGRMTAMKVLGRYLVLLIYPGTLSSDYSYNQIPLYGLGSVWQDAQCWLGLAAVGGLLGLAYWLRRIQPLLAWGISLIFVAQVLTANLLMPIGTIMAERFQYLPAVGYAVVAAQLLCWAGSALARRQGDPRFTPTVLAGALAAVLVVALGARTYLRNRDWQDSSALWKSAMEASPNSFKAYKGYANTYWHSVADQHTGDSALEEQTIDQCIQYAEHGLSILDNPPLPISIQDNTLYQDLGEEYRIKGELLDKRGQHDEAVAYYQKSLAVLLRARAVDRWVNQTSQNAMRARGIPESQIRDVGNQKVYILLAETYFRLGDWQNFLSAANYVVHLAPLASDGYRLVAWADNGMGHMNDAIVATLDALLIDQHDGKCWNDLISYYQKIGLNPVPVTPYPQGNTYQLHQEVPLVRQELNEAGVELIQRLKENKYFEEAKSEQQTLIQNVKIPADLFDKNSSP